MKNESIRSLIELLVQKAGFDINKKDSEQELEKTIKNIARYESELNTAKSEFDKLVIKNSLNSLKVRKKYWDDNAEVIGRNLYSSYKNGVAIDSVRNKIEKLAELALFDEKEIKEGSLMSFIYTSIRSLEEKLLSLKDKINTFDYKDETTVELDKKMQGYLKDKIEEMNKDESSIDKELDDLKNVESRETTTLEKVKEYIASVTKDLARLEKVKEDTLTKEVSIEIWDKLERMIATLTTRIESAEDTVKRLENSLEDARKNRNILNSRKKHLESELKASESRLTSISERINKDDYVDTLQKIIDLNNKELLEIKLKSLQNKKEVIYINVEQVKNELIAEWSKRPETTDINLEYKELEKELEPEDKKEVLVEAEEELFIEIKEENHPPVNNDETENSEESLDEFVDEVAKEIENDIKASEQTILESGEFKDNEIKEEKPKEEKLEETKYEFEW